MIMHARTHVRVRPCKFPSMAHTSHTYMHVHVHVLTCMYMQYTYMHMYMQITIISIICTDGKIEIGYGSYIKLVCPIQI